MLERQDPGRRQQFPLEGLHLLQVLTSSMANISQSFCRKLLARADWGAHLMVLVAGRTCSEQCSHALLDQSLCRRKDGWDSRKRHIYVRFLIHQLGTLSIAEITQHNISNTLSSCACIWSLTTAPKSALYCLQRDKQPAVYTPAWAPSRC